jgi:hypothetical protein
MCLHSRSISLLGLLDPADEPFTQQQCHMPEDLHSCDRHCITTTFSRLALRLMKHLQQFIPRLFLQVWSTKGIKLTTHIHLELWLWTHGAVPPLPHVFIVWCLINHRYNIILIQCHNKRLCIANAAVTETADKQKVTNDNYWQNVCYWLLAAYNPHYTNSYI